MEGRSLGNIQEDGGRRCNSRSRVGADPTPRVPQALLQDAFPEDPPTHTKDWGGQASGWALNNKLPYPQVFLQSCSHRKANGRQAPDRRKRPRTWGS